MYYVEAKSTEREYGHLAKVLDSFENFLGLPQLQVTETQLRVSKGKQGNLLAQVTKPKEGPGG